ncbi:unnamed protein product [Mytilus edulis]|uniref:Mutator-like transposase domain-containing protein n=1 Tax=Mytilus edulis TaxID=6550 RepID=A0A8S3R5U1_MYTED|nr:unnamed protein product [Mytilus edulis]
MDNSKSRKRKRGKKSTKDKKSMLFEYKYSLKESDKGSYYNQAHAFEQLETEESSDTDSSTDFGNQSVSFRKLNSSGTCIIGEESENENSEKEEEDVDEVEDEANSGVHGRLIIHLKPLQESVLSAAVCRNCHIGSLKLEILPGQRGFCSRLHWICENCHHTCEFYSDSNTGYGSGHSKDINRLSVLAMRTVGKSRSALFKFCSIMDLPAPINYKPYTNHTEALKEVAEKTCRDTMLESAEELKKIKCDSSEWDGEGPCKCAVSVDGSWAHVGYSARNGFVSVITIDTGKVLDYVTLSNECKGCKKWEREGKTNTREFLAWFVEHDKVCTLNHEGSAKTMEAQGAVMLFRRSEEFNGLQYTTFVGDGDSLAFGSVVDTHPYGPNIIIQKEDGVGHIQGRMGKHLKRLVDQNKGITKEEPQHQYCPEGELSWCKWQTDKVLGTSSYRPLKSPTLIEMLKPVFEKLSSLQLLKGAEKCLTQNQNESLHHVIWSYLPKGEYHSPSEIQLGVALAVGHFNEGMNNYNSKLFDEMNLKIGINNKSLWMQIDVTRLKHAAYKHSANVKQRRKNLKAMEAGKLEQYYSSASVSVTSNKNKTQRKCKKCGNPMKGHKRGSCEQANVD